MPVAHATTKYIRVIPRKARLAIDLIRGKDVMDAVLQLTHCKLKAGRLILKTLKSAIANAENNGDAKRESLIVSEAKVDEGSHYKRAWSRSKGRKSMVLRRTSHFSIALDFASNAPVKHAPKKTSKKIVEGKASKGQLHRKEGNN